MCRKNVRANGIVVFGVLTFFFIVTLSELRVKCVIRFGRFFKKKKKRANENARKGSLFSAGHHLQEGLTKFDYR